MRIPAPELFTGTHYGAMVRTFLNACKTNFTLTGISGGNSKVLFAKTRLLDTACIWYDSQDYNEITVTLASVEYRMLD